MDTTKNAQISNVQATPSNAIPYLETTATNEVILRACIEHSKMYFWEYYMHEDRCVNRFRSALYPGEKKVWEDYPTSIVSAGLIHPDYIDVFLDAHRRIKNGEKSVEVTIKSYLSPDNNWYLIRYTVLYNEMGESLKAIGSAQNISEQVWAEERYHQAMAYSSMMCQQSICTCFYNLTRNTIEERTCSISTFIGNAHLGIDEFFEFVRTLIVSDKARSEHQHIFTRVGLINRFLAGQTSISIEVPILVEEQKIRWISITVNMTRHPGTSDIIAFTYVQDIHENKIAQIIATTIGISDYDCIVIWDTKNGTFEWFGKYCPFTPETSGNDFSSVLQASIKDIADPADWQRCSEKLTLPVIKETLKNEPYFSLCYKTKAANNRHEYKNLKFMYSGTEENIILMTCSNVTSLYEAQERNNAILSKALQAAEHASRAKSMFLSSMSHDIRTPMNAIVGMAELAKMDIGNQEKVAQSLSVITTSSRQLLGLINDVLDMAQIESGRVALINERFDIYIAIGEVQSIIDPLLQNKQQSLCIDVSSLKHRYFFGDVVRLNRVLLNLLSNASKFSPQNGEIRLRFWDKVTSKPDLVILSFSVEDDGIGIDKERLPYIFEPFYREGIASVNQIEGTGLGLSITKGIVDMRGGHIKVESSLGKGTTFTVDAPIALAPQDSLTDIKNNYEVNFYGGPNLQGMQVLLVEDHPINTLVSTRLLEKYGITVTAVDNGAKCLELFSNSRRGTFDLILMDIQMPVMNGYQATEAIRNSSHPQSKSIPIIAMTANVFAEDQRRALQSGMNAHLAKPIDPKQLLQTLYSYQAKCGPTYCANSMSACK